MSQIAEIDTFFNIKDSKTGMFKFVDDCLGHKGIW